MRPFRRDKYPGRICLPIVETTGEKALRAVAEANGLADLIELRLDYLKAPSLESLLAKGKKPLIVTNRRREEGGRYGGDEKKRLGILREAADLGADFVDAELGSERSLLKELINHKNRSQFILSFHDFQRTPSPGELRNLCGRMMGWGAEVVKIVPFARSFEDNLKILSLLSYARERKQKIVAFCMGEKGKMSRIFAPLMGAAWTYASWKRQKASAPGQLTALELKGIWERLA